MVVRVSLTFVIGVQTIILYKNQSVVIVEQLGLATNQGSHEDTEWKNRMCEKGNKYHHIIKKYSIMHFNMFTTI
jgi:hypothetical protein